MNRPEWYQVGCVLPPQSPSFHQPALVSFVGSDLMSGYLCLMGSPQGYAGLCHFLLPLV